MSRKTAKETYEQVYDGEPFELPLNKQWHLACCHCGLVHDVKIEAVGDQFRMTVRQNKTRTKRLRKEDPAGFECKPVKGKRKVPGE